MDSPLHVFLLFCILLFSTVNSRCTDEEPLPTTLNNFGRYALTESIHIHGVYKMKYTESSNIVFRTGSSPALFRFVIGAKDNIDLDIYLWKNTSLVVSSLTAFNEDMINAEVSPETDYRIEIRPFGVSKIDEACESVLLELQLIPKEIMQQRYADYNYCPGAEFLPSLNFRPLDLGLPFVYDSSTDAGGLYARSYNVYSDHSGSAYTIRNVYAYNFTLTAIPGRTSMWSVEGLLGHHFLSGGSTRLVLTPHGQDPTRCLFNADCVQGSNLIPNHNVIKTATGPGSYSLWIIDFTGKRFQSLPSCSPISFRLSVQLLDEEENFVSCDAERIPKNLNDPGYLDLTGYLHFREDVFIELSDNNRQIISFTLSSPSLFRVYVEGHRLDIDIFVKNSAGAQLAAGFSPVGLEESIALQLDAGDYTIEISYFNSIDTLFCEIFFLEIAIEPSASTFQVDFCSSAVQSSPDLLFLEDLAPESVIIDSSFIQLNPAPQQKFLTQSISVQTSSVFVLEIESNFLLADMKLILKNTVDNSEFEVERRLNEYVIEAILLENVQYELTVSLARANSGSQELNLFPHCVLYNFKLSVSPIGTVPLGSCYTYDPLPITLNSPGYLDTSNRVHIQERFLIPKRGSGEYNIESTTFTVRDISLFRAFTEPHTIDIEIELLENGVTLPHYEHLEGEEKVTAILVPGKHYTMKVFFNYGLHEVQYCESWNLELEISPVDLDETEDCNTLNLPTASIFNREIGELFEFSGAFVFPQSTDRLVHAFPLHLDQPYFIRTLIKYNFVWTNLLVKITDQQNTTIFYGENLGNKNEIKTVLIPPGDYYIFIEEMAPLESIELNRCVYFSFELGLFKAQSHQIERNLCDKLYLADSFDSIQYLSTLSDYSVHFLQDVRVDTLHREERATFELFEKSYFRNFVPNHKTVDIDISIINKDGRSVLSSNGFGDELIFGLLPIGKYTYKVRYYPKAHHDLPLHSECVSYQNQVAIYKESFIIEELSSLDCSLARDHPLYIDVDLSEPLEGSIFMKTGSPYTTRLRFTVSETGIFRSRFEYVFISGGTSLALEGFNVVSPYVSFPFNKTIPGNYGFDSAYLEALIFPGDYELVVTDSANYERVSIECTQATYSISFESSDIPEDYCDEIDILPFDLWDPAGGSAPYGGPQNPDGSIRVTGQHFLVPEHNSHSEMTFRITEPSWIRVFMEAPYEDDIDFILWGDVEKTQFIFSSMGVEKVESKVALLEASNSSYLLDIFIYDRSEKPCAYVMFELEIKPSVLVEAALACPSPLPSPVLPPSVIHFPAGEYVSIFDDFLFTAEFIEQNAVDRFFYKEISYDIQFEIESNYSLFVILGYNFLVTDMQISLLTPEHVLLANGISASSVNEDSYVDFLTYFQIEDIKAGSYIFRISEKVWPAHGDKRGQCDKFYLVLSAGSDDSTNQNPRVSFVQPPSGENLDASSPLTLTIELSESLLSSFTSRYITENHLIYLIDGTNKVYPSALRLENERTTIMATFASSSLQFGKTYTLAILSEQFESSNGVFNSFYTTSHYSTLSCDCNGRGQCSPNAVHPGQCVCIAPYTGFSCQTCDSDHYPSGRECLPRAYCGNEDCSGHGICDDKYGFPVCDCNDGYESTIDGKCNECQIGYTGYPQCEPNPEDQDRSSRCAAPILPTTLDTVDYLGFNGYFQIQGDFYIDLNHYSHTIDFTLDETKVFRIYSEPHKVDIDIWLFQKTANTSSVIDYGVSFNEEESIFEILEPGNYQIVFYYYTFGKQTGDCETFNLELAIEGTEKAISEVSNWSEQCAEKSTIPRSIGDFTVTEEGFEFNDEALYFVNKGETDFYSFDFTVPAVQGKALLLTSYMEYRFLVGDIAVRLERREDNKTIAIGSNLYNRHLLTAHVHEGTYSLVLYQPEEQKEILSSCVPYTFSVSGKYVNREEDMFNCNIPELPDSLSDDPTYLLGSDYLHFSDEFYVDPDRNYFDFRVKTDSSFRIAIEFDHDIILEMFTIDNSGDPTLVEQKSGANIELFAHVSTDQLYRVKLEYLLINPGFCPTIKIQIAIAPDIAVAEFDLICPEAEKLPVIPQVISGTFEIPQELFVSFSTQENIAVYQFRVNTRSVLNIGVSSDFLRSSLQVQLRLPNMQLVDGDFSYNYNSIKDLVVEPGFYQISILQREYSPYLVPCTEFNFDMQISLDETKCADADIRALPSNLNSMRYLGWDHSLFLHSKSWLIPEGQHTHQIHIIDFTFKIQSTIRIFIEEHDVDVDVRIKRKDNNAEVASAPNLFSEESLVASLEIGDYYIQLDFFNWAVGSIPPCSTFNMQIAVEPSGHFDEKSCTEMGMTENRHFPNLPETISTFPYSLVNQQMHFQQNQNDGLDLTVQEYSIYISSDFDVHIQLDYKFISADIGIKLTHTQSDLSISGLNEEGREVLAAHGLPRGYYKLRISQPVSNQNLMGCVLATLSVNLRESKDVDFKVEEALMHLPDLSSLAHLKYSNDFHLSNDYILFDRPSSDTTILMVNVEEESLFRLNIPSSIISIQVDGEKTYYDHVALLPTGEHQINIKYETFRVKATITEKVEFAVAPTSEIRDAISRQTKRGSCENTDAPIFELPPNGYFIYKDTHFVTPARHQNDIEIMSIPFTLEYESVVSFQLGYYFLLSNFELSVSGGDLRDDVWGRNTWNGNDLISVLPSGSYVLKVSQHSLWDASFNLDYCVEFTLQASIGKSSGNSDRSDCTKYSLFPWNFNTENGGSKPFGGPIRNNKLSFFGDEFLFDSASNLLEARFEVTEQSLLGLFATDNSYVDATIRLTSQSETEVTPLATVAPYAQIALIYKLTPGIYTIEIPYQNDQNTRTCNTFSFGLNLSPYQTIINEITCAPSDVEALPRNSISLDINGHYSEAIESVIKQATLGTEDMFEYAIDFSVEETSFLSTSVSFNPSVNILKLTLLYREDDTLLTRAVSSFETVNSEDGFYGLTSKLHLYLESGNYVLKIQQQQIQYESSNLCFPYEYAIAIEPISDNSPEILYVDPFSGDLLDPNKELVLEIAFSTKLYAAVGGEYKQITGTSYLNVLQNAICLSDGRQGSQLLCATSVESVGSDFTIWKFRFASNFASGQNYHLTIVDGKIFNEQGLLVRLNEPHNYKMMDVECSGNGKINPDSLECDCDEGYKPPLCQVCIEEYVLDLQGFCVPEDICARTQDLCGEYGECTSLPYGEHQCNCSGFITGDQCDVCMQGYINFPECTRYIPCELNCNQGICNGTIGECACPENFLPGNCSICVEGFKGDDCKTPIIDVVPPNPLVIVGVMLLIVVIVALIAFVISKRCKPVTYVDDATNFALHSYPSSSTDQDIEPKFSSSSTSEIGDDVFGKETPQEENPIFTLTV